MKGLGKNSAWIQINDKFAICRDSAQWILREAFDENPEKNRKKIGYDNLYFPTLEKVFNYLLDLAPVKGSSLEHMERLMADMKYEILIALQNPKLHKIAKEPMGSTDYMSRPQWNAVA